MNDKFSKRLEEYLSSECNDFSMSYEWRWDEDYEYCVATISTQHTKPLTKEVNFRYDDENDVLLIELSEDSWYSTEEYSYTVKYFWMLVAPALFPE